MIALTLRGGERLVACYDGHCGELCAQYCKEHLHETLQAQPGFGSDGTVGEALEQTFRLVNSSFIAGDAQSADPEHGGSGTAAVAVRARSGARARARVRVRVRVRVGLGLELGVGLGESTAGVR